MLGTHDLFNIAMRDTRLHAAVAVRRRHAANLAWNDFIGWQIIANNCNKREVASLVLFFYKALYTYIVYIHTNKLIALLQLYPIADRSDEYYNNEQKKFSR